MAGTWRCYSEAINHCPASNCKVGHNPSLTSERVLRKRQDRARFKFVDTPQLKSQSSI
jgi:hypothetical protein